MPKYIIKWNAGSYAEADLIISDNDKEAENEAYNRWLAEAENQAEFSACEATEENLQDAIDAGLIDQNMVDSLNDK